MTLLAQGLGGLGLFLLGMVLLTDSLRLLAGALIRRALMRFTHNPLSGALTGALATAVLQSSSATTVAAVGFVGAGLMTFSESLGIIFGANIGTTITGWLVALIGFKFKLGSIMLPAIFIGVVLRLFAHGRLAHLGMALAGFALIFVGISNMQQGMSGLQSIVTPDRFPTDTFSGRLQLVAIGVLITIVTQSSSAGVAAALTALNAGAIDFTQAASLVIGMDVGTTFTTAVATIGATSGARRTGFSHVIYNAITAAGALAFLSVYTYAWRTLAPEHFALNPEIALVGFHSAFNLLGVIIVLPFTAVFGRLIQHIIPDRADAYTQSLDQKLLAEPDLALTAAQAAIHVELKALLGHLHAMLDAQSEHQKIDLGALQSALDETHDYVDQIHLPKSEKPDWKILISLIHSLDHMQRLHERCEEDENRANTARDMPELKGHVEQIRIHLRRIIADIQGNHWDAAAASAKTFSSSLAKEARHLRRNVTTKVAEGAIDVLTGTQSLEGIRWLRRVSAHILRITDHQAKANRQLRRK